ncbi:hypothetical protein DCAR_0417400 [Daucus carota subsp. sativus]|uniref:Uncharacterized protein n=1 Tax=Daucus carota subsp. sativus TaxID=79200 RepID=A0AAF0WYM7_DAUCS|nr:hypothetical protein DCAR_0417400 [Daucus carota subsp. sativus]
MPICLSHSCSRNWRTSNELASGLSRYHGYVPSTPMAVET